MSVQSVSFYQQDRDFWSKAKANSQSLSATTSVINAMASAETNLGKGLAGIANGQALDRVDNQITSIVQQVLKGSSSSSSSTGSSSSASGTGTTSSSTSPTPATGTGSVVLTTTTPLSTLGILPGGTITVGTGSNTTTYTSTGTDTIGDLINTLNVNLPGNANVTATLNTRGKLVITSRDKTSAIYIGGSGTDASAIGFGLNNNTFPAKAASKTATTSKSSSTSSTSSSASSSSKTTSSSSSSHKSALPSLLAYTEQGVTTASGILSDSGVGGSLVDLLS